MHPLVRDIKLCLKGSHVEERLCLRFHWLETRWFTLEGISRWCRLTAQLLHSRVTLPGARYREINPTGPSRIEANLVTVAAAFLVLCRRLLSSFSAFTSPHAPGEQRGTDFRLWPV